MHRNLFRYAFNAAMYKIAASANTDVNNVDVNE